MRILLIRHAEPAYENDSLTEKGEQMGVKVHVMHEDIFNAMHKI